LAPYITADFFLDRFVRLRYKMSKDGTQIFIVGHDDRRPQIGARSPGFSRFCARAAKTRTPELARDGGMPAVAVTDVNNLFGVYEISDTLAKAGVQPIVGCLLSVDLDEAAPANRANVRQQFARVASTLQGSYALIDYVNFKGEGTLHTERYRDQGWGLLQVLEQMRGATDGPSAVEEFSRSAAAVLRRRVQNSPPARKESRWLPGWINRVSSYAGNS